MKKNEIRFDLEDIFETKLVDDILHAINLTADKITIDRVTFWHNGKVTEKQLNDFSEKAYKIITKSFPIRFSKRSPHKEYVWFDVINEDNARGSRNRYSHIYPMNKKSDMFFGLYKFSTVVKFIESNGQGRRIYYKPTKEK